jgi:hypothetical protein
MRKIRLTFSTGETAVADMLDSEAPRVCEYIWNLLPLEGRAIHGMYSGAEVFLLIDNAQAAARENLVHIPLPGELLYFFDDGASGVGRGSPVGEICFVYGRGVRLTAHEGLPTQASLFARIPGDWKYDWLDFGKGCRKSRWEGPQLLRIEPVTP